MWQKAALQPKYFDPKNNEIDNFRPKTVNMNRKPSLFVTVALERTKDIEII